MESGMDDGMEEAAPKRKGPMFKILVIVIAAAVAGVAVWFLFLSNVAPTATFTAETVNRRVVVSAEDSRDPDGRIVSYTWNWGDNSSVTTTRWPRAAHDYASDQPYTITLTITDSKGGAASASQSVTVEVKPTAFFLARHDQMVVSFDAARSLPLPGSSITTYSWDFGDGETGTGEQTSHTYATAGRREVSLTVTDAAGKSNTAKRYVSPASTTVDILVDQMFEGGCPYRGYWELRRDVYGDVLLQETTPCTDFYPWVLFTDDPENNPSFIYTLYQWTATARNHPGYSLQDPVLLPVFNASVAPDGGSYVTTDYTFGYVDDLVFNEYATTPLALADWVKSDGFGHVVRGNITMDLTMSKRIFGVEALTAADAQSWWDSNTASGRPVGPLESRVSAWLVTNANTKYDIYNAFEWFYQTDITDLSGTVSPVDGTTTVEFFLSGWGFEILQDRMFYWGRASYRDAVCVQGPLDPTCPATLPYGSILPLGWMPMESCWCEQSQVTYTIRQSLDLDMVAYNGYHVGASTNWGSDGLPRTPDDLPAWAFEAMNVDYVPRAGSTSPGAGGSSYPNSELRFWEGQRLYHGTPGSFAFGEPYEYLVARARWPFVAGSTLTIVLPTFDVPWYDPHESRWDPIANVGDYATFDAPMTLRFVRPGTGYYIWDPWGKVLSFAGPHDWGVASTVLPLEGAPYVEFAPEEMPG